MSDTISDCRWVHLCWVLHFFLVGSVLASLLDGWDLMQVRQNHRCDEVVLIIIVSSGLVAPLACLRVTLVLLLLKVVNLWDSFGACALWDLLTDDNGSHHNFLTLIGHTTKIVGRGSRNCCFGMLNICKILIVGSTVSLAVHRRCCAICPDNLLPEAACLDHVLYSVSLVLNA